MHVRNFIHVGGSSSTFRKQKPYHISTRSRIDFSLIQKDNCSSIPERFWTLLRVTNQQKNQKNRSPYHFFFVWLWSPGRVALHVSGSRFTFFLWCLRGLEGSPKSWCQSLAFPKIHILCVSTRAPWSCVASYSIVGVLHCFLYIFMVQSYGVLLFFMMNHQQQQRMQVRMLQVCGEFATFVALAGFLGMTRAVLLFVSLAALFWRRSKQRVWYGSLWFSWYVTRSVDQARQAQFGSAVFDEGFAWSGQNSMFRL